jgi:hypothetical protein
LLWQSRNWASLPVLEYLVNTIGKEDLEVNKNTPSASTRLEYRQASHREQAWTLTAICGVDNPYHAEDQPSEHVQGQSVAGTPSRCFRKGCNSNFDSLSWLSISDLRQEN